MSRTASSSSSRVEDNVPRMQSLPITVFHFGVLPFLGPSEVLSLRTTCRTLYTWLTPTYESKLETKQQGRSTGSSLDADNGDSTKQSETCDSLDDQVIEKLYDILLERDFDYHATTWNRADGSYQTLNVSDASAEAVNRARPGDSGQVVLYQNVVFTAFGVSCCIGECHFTHEDNVLLTPSSFVAWKYLVKASHRYYKKKRSDTMVQEEKDMQDEGNGKMLHAPYFLRAALAWDKIFRFYREDYSKGLWTHEDYTGRLYLRPGVLYRDWGSLAEETGLLACQAMFAFCGGNISGREPLGLFGGYQAYDHFQFTRLSFPGNNVVSSLISKREIIVAQKFGDTPDSTRKCFQVDVDTGELCLVSKISPDSERDRCRAVNIADRSTGLDDFLLWSEEFAARLDDGRYRCTPLEDLDYGIVGLYPNFSKSESVAPVITMGVQPVSRAVTRGVEVIASAVYLPHQLGMSFIYRIRIRILTPDDHDYVSPIDRGFQTCQLYSRHWEISDELRGIVDRVDGEGVIGRYPVLFEGGYSEGGRSVPGTFAYQVSSNASILAFICTRIVHLITSLQPSRAWGLDLGVVIFRGI